MYQHSSRGGLQMGVRKFGLCLLGILATQSAALADYSIVSSKSDFEPRVGLSATGPNGVYTTTNSTTANNVRVGISGGSTNRVYADVAYMFQLPVLAPGETITGASLKLTELVDAAAGTPAANSDLWALGFDNNNPPLDSATESQVYFFNGTLDTNGGIGIGAARTLIQDNFLVPTDVVLAGSPATHQTSAAGGASLLAYIQSLYANPNLIPGTSNVILRLNYDSDTYAPTSATAANRYMLGSADNTDTTVLPTLTLNTQQIPEPMALSIFGSALLVLSTRQRRKV
jgi:hypothetical protein